MIFQDADDRAQPGVKVGDQIAEAIKVHHSKVSGSELRGAASSCSTSSASPNPEVRYEQYPHESRAACGSAR